MHAGRQAKGQGLAGRRLVVTHEGRQGGRELRKKAGSHSCRHIQEDGLAGTVEGW